jgi:hypothetical protein
MQLRFTPVFVALLAASCAESSDSETEQRVELHSAPTVEPAGLCAGGPCNDGFGALEFINSSGAVRRVYVNEEPVCVLAADERCEVEVVSGEHAAIHVTGEYDEETCSDPSATLTSCVCAHFEILC